MKKGKVRKVGLNKSLVVYSFFNATCTFLFAFFIIISIVILNNFKLRTFFHFNTLGFVPFSCYAKIYISVEFCLH